MSKETKNKEKKEKQNKEKTHFLKDVKAELKKVIWPTPKQLFNNTVAVIAIVIIVGVIVFLLDLCFEKANTFGVNKLKSIVQSTQTNQETENTESTNTAEENTEVKANTESVEENDANSAKNAE